MEDTQPPASYDLDENSVETNTINDNGTKLDRRALTTKTAVTFLLEGKLKDNVCRYCLNVDTTLTELDRIIHIAIKGVICNVTVRNMIASFHPFKVEDDPNFPNKICEICLEQVLSSYLFALQCERAERALRNGFDDIYEKINKLDSLEKTKKRGRAKLNPNYNILYTEHENIIDYAEPVINLINTYTELQDDTTHSEETKFRQYECLKCWQVYPSALALLNHEKIHPTSMWYHCRECGRSFPKRGQLKKHVQFNHSKKTRLNDSDITFTCKECNHVSTNYSTHLEHIEKHKFKRALKNLVERKMDRLCAVCLDKGNLKNLDQMICLHGGSPGLTGDVTLFNILGSIIPNMNSLHAYTGNKICDKCFNSVVSSYIFISFVNNIRSRLNSCITLTLDSLNDIKFPDENVFIEISQNAILSVKDDFDEYLLLNDNEEIDESKLKIDILEDEFREPEENESSEESLSDESSLEFAPAMVKKYYVNNRKLYNGYQQKSSKDISEFLTFNKRQLPQNTCKNRYRCPFCNKKFITNYFLQKHIGKHCNRKVECLVCNQSFKSKFYLYEHVKITHLLNKDNYFTCLTCGRVFVNINKYNAHIGSHGQKQCDLCNKLFISQKHYENHLFRHIIKYKLSKRENTKYCSFCEKDYPNNNELSLHVNKAHLQIKPYACDMCDRHYYTELNLQSHKKLHTLPSKEECKFCDKIFKSRRALVIHIRKHIDKRPFKCKVCSEEFYSETKAKIHLKKVHGGIHCCVICKTIFKVKKDYEKHNDHCNLLSQCY